MSQTYFFLSIAGIRCYIQNDSYESLEAVVPGPKETPYEEIQFKIAMEFDSHYPFRPPSAKFITPVYHPNIDTGNSNKTIEIDRKFGFRKKKLSFIFELFFFSDGKICLDVLRMPPGGSYNPAITLESILLSIQLLLASPNPDDPLRDDVSDEYRYNRELFNKNARKLSGSGDDGKKEAEVGHSSKKLKTDTEEIHKHNSKESNATTNEDEIPNTSNGDESSANERIPIQSKSTRKRKHDET